MTELVSHVEQRIGARGLFRDGQCILVAVSGGVDSNVLVHLLWELAKKHRWKLTVAHFNHQLRKPQSDADERLVKITARKLRLPIKVGRADVRAFALEKGLSVEMAARQLRHEFLAKTAVSLKASTIALAHHADDQVETFFLRLLRGTSGSGLTGMKWSNPSPAHAKIRLARPLLDLPKLALVAFAQERKIAFSDDATNACLDIQRNRIRNELIPLLTRYYQPALRGVIGRLMDVIGAEAECVAEIARQWLNAAKKPGFDRLPVALQRAVILQQLTDTHLSPDYALVERLRGGTGQCINTNANRSVSRNAAGMLQFRRLEPLEFNPQRRKLSLMAKEREIAFAGLKIRWDFAVDNGTANANKRKDLEYFDADKVGKTVWLRCWQPGDRFQPIGTGSPRKLQDLFTNLKVAKAERRQRVVAVTRKGELFWVEGLRMSEKFKLDEKTARRLKWSWRRENQGRIVTVAQHRGQ